MHPHNTPTSNFPYNNNNNDRGNTYEGFFLDHSRSGPGTLFRGNVKRVYDPRSGKKALKSNRIYEGTWRANELRTGSMVRLCKNIKYHPALPTPTIYTFHDEEKKRRRNKKPGGGKLYCLETVRKGIV